MGFESSRTARRRLAALAGTDRRVYEALAPSLFPGLNDAEGSSRSDGEVYEKKEHSSATLNAHLDELARDIVATPGAGGALLTAYAEQTRALLLVIEAARRAGGEPLPESVVAVAQKALDLHGAISGLVPA